MNTRTLSLDLFSRNACALLVRCCLCAVMVLAVQGAVVAQPAASIDSITSGLSRQDGFIPFYFDEPGGRVLLEIPAFGEDVLYYVSAASGVGSVELGIDRGIMASKVIHFTRSGPKVLVEEQNMDYRALDGTPARAENVKISFPTSVIASLLILGEEGGTVLVDGTALFMRDAAGVEARLNDNNQGTFRYDSSRGGFYAPRMKGFPDNTEIETYATFSISNAGPVTRNVVPDTTALTLRIHHSFLQAPTGYSPRLADSRIGVSSMAFRDYSNPINDATETRWVTRWRLEKQNPDAAMSEPVEPIVFYLDPAIPDDIREVMRIGTLWWNEAFEAAGFINALEVREPEPDMDPMDIRYAWVQWIERDERGFSSGGTFRDPRTGEILGSKTRMDSHRIRTVANYWESYMQAASSGMPEGQKQMALLRQSVLIAHELGHVLGFQHNWAASINGRASVMEYPTPRVKVLEGEIDLSDSFAVGIGTYDMFMVRYGYSEFATADETQALDALIDEMRDEDLLFVPSTDPRWAWYDDLSSPTDYLRVTMEARDIMLSRYGMDNLQDNEPVGSLRDMRLWMVYLHHRWAIESGHRFIGGMYHNFVNKGDDLLPTLIVPGTLQREILDLMMQAIQPEKLVIPEDLLQLLTPHPGVNLEDMSGGYAFDQLQAAGILAGLVIEPLLDAERAARLVSFSAREPGTLSLPEMLDTLLANTWYADSSDDAGTRAIAQMTQSITLLSLMQLGGDEVASPLVRSYVLDLLAKLRDDINDNVDSRRARDPMLGAHYRQAVRDIDRFLADPAAHTPGAVTPAWGSRPRSRYPLPPGPPL